jgi:hypothetical protein
MNDLVFALLMVLPVAVCLVTVSSLAPPLPPVPDAV